MKFWNLIKRCTNLMNKQDISGRELMLLLSYDELEMLATAVNFYVSKSGAQVYDYLGWMQLREELL